MNVGIDSMGVAVPEAYIELADLAVARGIVPEKFTEGLGVRRMAVPNVHEDTVSLAARAGRQALALAGIDPADIGLLAVGTETAVDHSKPVASFVQGLLGIPTACRVIETKHACYGGTAALQLAADWVRAGSNRGKKALVICSDIARYGLRTPGEPTQGGGAVALVVAQDPAILTLEADAGVYSQDEHDFWRPLYSRDALVDGKYSVSCYLRALAGAYQAHRDIAGVQATNGARYSDRFAALAYHVPYCKMAKKAHGALRELEGDANPEVTFATQVAPGLVYPAEVGNIYTGSLYLALVSALCEAPTDLKNQPIGLFSYGSGLCAEFFTGVVQPGAQARLRSLGLRDALAARRRLDVDEYEAIMHAREELDTRPVGTQTAPDFSYLGTAEHRRRYAPSMPS